jgi:hypothetical protein
MLANLSTEGLVRWLLTEAALFCILMIALWGAKKLITDGELLKWISILLIVIFGGWMFILLLRIAGVV